MKKWILGIILLVPALAFAAGLRIDFKLLMDVLQKKPDPNEAAFRKMGIDPAQAGYKRQSWWTFKPEDNLFRKWMEEIGGPKEQESDGSLQPGPDRLSAGLATRSRAQSLAQQARRTVENAEQKIQDGWA